MAKPEQSGDAKPRVLKKDSRATEEGADRLYAPTAGNSEVGVVFFTTPLVRHLKALEKETGMGCERLDSCSFYSKYKNGVDDHNKMMIQGYCLGSLHEMCKRKKYENSAKNSAPNNLCPSGYFSKRE